MQMNMRTKFTMRRLSWTVVLLGSVVAFAIGLLPRWGSSLCANIGSVYLVRATLEKKAGIIEDRFYAQQAILWLECAHYIGFDPSSLRLRIAQSYLVLGDVDKALTWLKPIGQLSSADNLSKYWLGLVYERSGQHSVAVRIWSDAGLASLALARANHLLNAGQSAEALGEYQLVLEMQPGNSAAWLGLGRVYKLQGRWADAFQAFLRASQDPSNQLEPLVEMADVYFYGYKDLAAALPLYERAIALVPRCYWCYLKLADFYQGTGQNDPAISVLERAIEKADLHDGSAHRRLAELYLTSGLTGQARETANAGLKRYPDDANLWFIFGETYAATSDWKSAENAYRKAVEMSPQEEKFLESLHRAQDALNHR